MSTDLTIDTMFPSKYLRAADLPRRGLAATIDAIEQEKLGDDDRWVVYFVEPAVKPLVLNKTNAHTIGDSLGRRVADWTGQKITLRVERVAFKGERVDAIRVAPIELNDDIEHIGNVAGSNATP